MTGKRILVVGGVAGGASCATRARRLSEDAEIVVFERGPHVSFASCGLPYFVGNVIEDEETLHVVSPDLLLSRFRIDVRTGCDVQKIDRAASEIEVREVGGGRVYRERYSALVLAPGATPLRPPIPGIDLPGIFSLRSIEDSVLIREWIERKRARRAVIVGAGFIGLEMAENLVKRGLAVEIVELADQVLPPLDSEMAAPVRAWLESKGIVVRLGDAVAAFGQEPGQIAVRTRSGEGIATDLVILGLGVRPETSLARAAGLAIGERNGIRVDEHMRTSDPTIWAIGDAVEVRDFVTGAWGLVALAGPAHRQGRIAADSIFGRAHAYRGTQGTAICGVLGLTVAMTGASEKALRRAGIEAFEKVYLHPAQHAGYFPGARPIDLKLIFSTADGRVLGAQAVGEEGVDKRIDVIAMAIQGGATVYDLEEAELCYAPQFGSAKDPVNLAGMIAANALRGDGPLARWEDVERNGFTLLDVREPHEFARGHVDRARNVPLSSIRDHIAEIPKDREIWTYCAGGQRSYYATRVLDQRGFRVRNLPGGYATFRAFEAAKRLR
jgi:NADPH-dependent 2,4-dienoyl-CoA reductase/sulfur reductase-like enzyme/rhodanese-related sulfurtransferase